MDAEQHDIDTDPPMPPRDGGGEVENDIRRPDGEPPAPAAPMRDRDPDAEER
jgi:hypothetical protein